LCGAEFGAPEAMTRGPWWLIPLTGAVERHFVFPEAFFWGGGTVSILSVAGSKQEAQPGQLFSCLNFVTFGH
jgi:hypothetical protein